MPTISYRTSLLTPQKFVLLISFMILVRENLGLFYLKLGLPCLLKDWSNALKKRITLYRLYPFANIWSHRGRICEVTFIDGFSKDCFLIVQYDTYDRKKTFFYFHFSRSDGHLNMYHSLMDFKSNGRMWCRI